MILCAIMLAVAVVISLALNWDGKRAFQRGFDAANENHERARRELRQILKGQADARDLAESTFNQN